MRHAAESFDAFDTAFYPGFGLPRRAGQEEFMCGINDCAHVFNGATSQNDINRHDAIYHGYCEFHQKFNCNEECIYCHHHLCRGECGLCNKRQSTDRDDEVRLYRQLEEEREVRLWAQSRRLARRYLRRKLTNRRRRLMVRRAFLKRVRH